MSLIFPPSLTPKSITWSLDPNFVPQESPSGFVARTARGMRKWSADLTMPPLTDEDAAIFSAFLTEAANHDGSFYLHNPGQALRGSFDASELLTNGDFTNGTTGWSLADSAALKVGSRLARVTNGGAVTSSIYQDAALTIGASYVSIGAFMQGGAADCRMVALRTSDTNFYVADNAVPYGVNVKSFTVSTSATTRVAYGVGTSVAGDDVYLSYASLARCLLVSGASQTGDSLAVDGGDASSNGLLKVGDMFTLMIDGVPSLHRLTRDLDTNSTGDGVLYFEPALPGSPADNAPIILRNPFCRMFIPGLASEAGYAPPRIASFSLSCRELVNR